MMKINDGKNWFKTAWLMALISALIFFPACKKKRQVFNFAYMAPLKKLSDDFFSLIFLSSFEGYVEPCGCTSNPLGGLARFSTVFNDIKTVAKNKLALIDAGNLLFESSIKNDADRCQDDARIDVLLSTMSTFDLYTTVAGPLDLARGEDYYRSALNKHRISSLATVKSAKDLPFSLKVITGPSFDIGVIGVSPAKDLAEKDLISQVNKAASLAKSSKTIKAVIAISHLGSAQTKRVFSNMRNVDIVIQGVVESMAPQTPTRINNHGPILIEGGRQGQYFTALILQNLTKRKDQQLVLDDRAFTAKAREELLLTRISSLKDSLKDAEQGKKAFLQQRIELAKNELIKTQDLGAWSPLSSPSVMFHTTALTKKIDATDHIDKKIERYENEIPLLVKKCEQGMVCPPAEEGAAIYVGVDTCKSCHQQAFDVWKKAVYFDTTLNDDGEEIKRSVGHSKAWKTLVDDNRDADRSCIGCHSIGFMEKGGYCKAFDVGFRKDVQCESCHGPGSLHAKSGDKKLINRQVSEETCRSCHHVPHIASYEAFNYEEKLIKILGQGHGEKLLRELTHKAKSDPL